MKVKYVFVNGDISEVEVEGAVAEFMETYRKKKQARDKYEQRHILSLEAMKYEGRELGCTLTPCEEYLKQEQAEILERALICLSPLQRRRFELFSGGYSYSEIARKEGVSHTMIRKSIAQSQLKLQECLKKQNFTKSPKV